VCSQPKDGSIGSTYADRRRATDNHFSNGLSHVRYGIEAAPDHFKREQTLIKQAQAIATPLYRPGFLSCQKALTHNCPRRNK
jgi:hypothetical protein